MILSEKLSEAVDQGTYPDYFSFYKIPEVIRQLPSSISEHIKFVLTLPERDFLENFPKESLAHIINTGPVPPQEGASLYLECDALFLPTLLECFSASYPEAMAMKKPILTSDLGFSRSICKNAALYFNPVDPVDIAEKITTLYQNHTLRNSLVMEGSKRLKEFDTAEERAIKYLKICESMIEQRAESIVHSA